MADLDLLAAIALVLASGSGLVAVRLADRRRAQLRGRLEALATVEQQRDTSPSLRRPQAAERWRFLPSGLRHRLEAELAAAGGRIGLLHLFAAALAAAAVVAGFMVGVLGTAPATTALVSIAAALGAPILLIRRMQRRYRDQFLAVFPDALDLIVRGVRAGLSVHDAVNVASDEIPAPVSSELRRSLDQMRIGVDMEEALQRTADRIRVPDFTFFVVSLAVQRRTGGTLAETLANLSGMLRRRKEIRTKSRALLAESRASMVVLSALPILVAVGLYLVSRDRMTTLVVDPRGRMLLGVAVLLLAAGILTMAGLVRRVVR